MISAFGVDHGEISKGVLGMLKPLGSVASSAGKKTGMTSSFGAAKPVMGATPGGVGQVGTKAKAPGTFFRNSATQTTNAAGKAKTRGGGFTTRGKVAMGGAGVGALGLGAAAGNGRRNY